MGPVTAFYRVWERGSKWLRSGGSLGGALGTWGLQLSIQRQSFVSPSHHPKPVGKPHIHSGDGADGSPRPFPLQKAR